MLDPLREAFYARQVMNPLSSGQVALWNALVYTREKAHNQEWFTIAGMTLVQLSGLSPTGIKKARNELKQQGFIEFRTNGTRATSYKVVDISESVQDGVRNSVQDSVRNSVQDSVRNSVQDSVRNSVALLHHQHNTGGGARTREAFQLLTDSEMDEAAVQYATTTRKLYEAMEAAGMPMTEKSRSAVEAMAAEHGLENVLAAIDKAAQHDTKGGVSVAYLNKIVTGGPKEQKPKLEKKRTKLYPVWKNGECVMREMVVDE